MPTPLHPDPRGPLLRDTVGEVAPRSIPGEADSYGNGRSPGTVACGLDRIDQVPNVGLAEIVSQSGGFGVDRDRLGETNRRHA